MRVRRRPWGDQVISKRLSVCFALLAIPWVVAGIVGIVQSKAGLIGFGMGAAIFFAGCAWSLWPRGPHEEVIRPK